MISFYNVKQYCCEDISLIENYDKAMSDTTQTWDCHHRRETIYDMKDLIEIDEYYNRPAIELIFLPHDLHRKIHNKIHKPYFCKEAQIKGGRIAGKKYGHLNGKIGGKITMRDHPEIHKLGGHIVGSLPWWTNGRVNKKSIECPGEGFYRGKTQKHKG